FSSRRRHTRWPRDWSSGVFSPISPPVGFSFLGKIKPTSSSNLVNFQQVPQEAFGDPLGIIAILLDPFRVGQSEHRQIVRLIQFRSEERREGKEGRFRWRRDR